MSFVAGDAVMLILFEITTKMNHHPSENSRFKLENQAAKKMRT
jgi:hypothetical protein